MNITSWATADLQMHHARTGRSMDSRKVANHTYLERHPNRDIAVRLHDTDIVTYHYDGSITLTTGGWSTPVTKARINAFTPRSVMVYSDKKRWMVTHRSTPVESEYGPYTRPDFNSAVRFQDGMRLVPVLMHEWLVENVDTDALVRHDRHNAFVDKLIRRATRSLDDERCLSLAKAATFNGGVDCALCVVLSRANESRPHYVGDDMQDTQHLIDHLVAGEVTPNMLYAACGFNSYRMAIATIARRDLRLYLGARLHQGAVNVSGFRKAA